MRARVCLILALASCLTCSIPSYAATPAHLWSQRFGGTATDTGNSVAVGASGDIFVAGSFQGTADFGGGPLVSAGSDDVFLAKYDTGGVLQWSRRFGGGGSDVGWAVAVDPSGNVVVAGSFSGTVDFGGGPLVSAGTSNAFVAKFDANGLHVWSRRLGGSSDETALGVTTDNLGNVIVTGEFVGVADFGGGTLVSAGWKDVFVAKYDANGAHQWSRRFGSSSADTGIAVAVDAAGSVFVAGEFQLSVDFGGGDLTAQGIDIFVAKYDTDGHHQWSRRFGDAVSSCLGAAVDASGGVVLTGFFAGAVDFGGGSLTSAGDVDIYLVKLDGDGAHEWSRRFGGTTYETGWSVCVDAAGSVYLSGDFRNTADFGGGDLVSAGLGDIFVAKYSAAGVHVFSERFGDVGDDTGHGIAVDASGNIIVTGAFGGTVDFGGGPLTSAGEADVFFAKYGAAEVCVDVKPGDCSNPLNTRVPSGGKAAGGVLAVAVLGSDEIDVHDIDISSLALEGVAPRSHRYKDIATPPSGSGDCACSKAGPDGHTDLALTFDRLDVVAGLSDTSGQVRLTLTGRTNDGMPIQGSDCVRIVSGKGDEGPQPAPMHSTPMTSLGRAYPNPFNPTTSIAFELATPDHARLEVYDVTGKLVDTLVDGELPDGRHEVTWEAGGLPSGIYFYRLSVGGSTWTRKMVLVR